MVSIKDKMNNIEQQMNSPRSGSELSAGRLHTGGFNIQGSNSTNIILSDIYWLINW